MPVSAAVAHLTGAAICGSAERQKLELLHLTIFRWNLTDTGAGGLASGQKLMSEGELLWKLYVCAREGLQGNARGVSKDGIMILKAVRWLERAEEAKRIAEGFTLPETRQQMLKISETYRHMAQSALEWGDDPQSENDTSSHAGDNRRERLVP
jgi:hypothetical protein